MILIVKFKYLKLHGTEFLDVYIKGFRIFSSTCYLNISWKAFA